VQKQQSTRLEDIVIDGSGSQIKGSLEVDQNGDLLNANFPVYNSSEGDKASLKVDRTPDGVFKLTMRGDVFDGRGFLKTAISGKEADPKSKTKNVDFDVDLKVGTVAGFYGEAARGVDVKMSRRNGSIRSFTMNAKLGRDTPLSGDLRGRAQGRDIVYIETNDAGAFFRFTDTYSKMFGGQLALAMDPPTTDSRAHEGLMNVRDFAIRGEPQLDRAAAGGPGVQNGISFSRLRAEFTRQNGQLTVREGVVKGPIIGATIEGSMDFPANQVRMSGTFVPMYGLNNMFGQIPIVGLFLGGGSNEGLIGVTYEIVGTPSQPQLRVNPISMMAPGVLRKIFEFNTGKQPNGIEFPASGN
jgi:AsmA-like C-terminal region